LKNNLGLRTVASNFVASLQTEIPLCITMRNVLIKEAPRAAVLHFVWNFGLEIIAAHRRVHVAKQPEVKLHDEATPRILYSISHQDSLKRILMGALRVIEYIRVFISFATILCPSVDRNTI
jgi:hypothetical protein